MDSLFSMRPLRRYEFEERDEDLIRVVIPRFGPGRIGTWLKSLFVLGDTTLDLDEIGSFVYSACDGRKTVADIAAGLKDRFGETIEPLEGRLTLFLREMFRRNLITFVKNGEVHPQ